jgi:hypothetical protein
MQKPRERRRRGVSTIIGTLIFLLILVIAFYTFATIFGYYNSYTQQLAKVSEQAQANSETQISISNFTFGVPANNVVAATTNSTDSFQRKVMYDLGLWWIFYSNGTGINYVTAPDGQTWSSPTSVTTSTGASNGNNFALWQSGSTVYYVLTGTTSAFLWRYGTLKSTGKITWTIAQKSVTTTNAVESYPSIITDSAGNVWVAFNAKSGSAYAVTVWKYTGSTWSEVNNIASVQSDAVPILVPLTSGVCLIYGRGASTSTVNVITTLTGSAWSAPVSPQSYYSLFHSSATSVGSTVYFIGLASASLGQTTGTVKSWSFTNGSSIVSSETTLDSTVESWSASISVVGEGLFAYYGYNQYTYLQYNPGDMWYPSSQMSSTETNANALSSPFSGVGSAWLSGTASLEIRFALPSYITLMDNSPFAIHAISLYVYNPSTLALVHYDTNSSAPGVSGEFNLWIGAGQAMAIPLGSFNYVAGDSYLFTVATDQGVLASASFVAS